MPLSLKMPRQNTRVVGDGEDFDLRVRVNSCCDSIFQVYTIWLHGVMVVFISIFFMNYNWSGHGFLLFSSRGISTVFMDAFLREFNT